MEKDTSPPIDITVYEPAELDDSIFNPMFREVREIIDRFAAGGTMKAKTFVAIERPSLIGQYAFAIPTAETLTMVARHSPLVEIGAGSGYWAMCLTACGADIIAYDRYPPGAADPGNISERNWHFRKSFYAVQKGDELSAAAHSERTLFLCWPPPENPMACRGLEAYMQAGGRTVIVIGQMNPISMGDVRLYEVLKGLATIERKRIHGWPGLTEEILICSCR